ncbi:MAG: hypothetical protein LQ341_003114 [Variospora aurantia]|nr:MAG: hypothetical protein LQ341_003114 [Variospora aurantia]
MELFDYLPSDFCEFLFGSSGIPAQAPLLDDAYGIEGRLRPSTSGYGAFNADREREACAWHQDRNQYEPHLNSRSRPAFNAFEGSDSWRPERFGHAQPWVPTYAGGAEADTFPFEPGRTHQRAKGRQHQRSTWYHTPPQRPCRGRHDQWLPPGHMSAWDDDKNEGGPWTDYAQRVPAYTVEEPDDNLTNEPIQFPHRSRFMGQHGTHGEQEMPQEEEQEEEGERWGPVGLGANFTKRTSQPGTCWTSLHSPSIFPHPHADSIRYRTPFSERSDYSPPPSPSRYPSPEHVPYEKGRAGDFTHSSRAPPIAGLTNEDGINVYRVNQKLQRQTTRLCHMLRQQARELDSRETRVRQQEARIARAVDVYLGVGEKTSP